jgi:hypothetical protein
MDSQIQQEVNLVASFVDTAAPSFHSAFGAPAILNLSTMQYESQEVHDLRETLEFQHKVVGKYVDFTSDLNKCSWDDVHQQLAKAQATAEKSEKRGEQPLRKVWRKIGSTSSILALGLSALPDNLLVTNNTHPWVPIGT